MSTPSTQENIAIDIQGIRRTFGRKIALNDVTIPIPKKGVFGLLGPNGAGKTTLMSVCSGFLRPDSGTVKILGIDIRQISKLRGRLSILPQDAQFMANVPILEQLVFFAQLNGSNRVDAEKEAMNALGTVGLADQAKEDPRILSHGMSKRVGIAQAFLGTPEVILLDEPTAGLDPAAAQGIRDIIDYLKGRATVIVSSHDLAEIQKMCDSVVILNHGNVVTQSSVADLTFAGKIIRMRFHRPLNGEEIQKVQVLPVVDSVELEAEGLYRLSINTEDTGQNQNDIITAIVKILAEYNVVPRHIEEGVALQTRFIEVTQGSGSQHSAIPPGYQGQAPQPQ